MKQFTTYGVKIHAASMKPIRDMIVIYRQAVDFLIRACVEDWGQLSAIDKVSQRWNYVEGLVHHTKERPVVKYEDFDRVFYKLPSYMRRAAVSEAIGKVFSYKSNKTHCTKEGNGISPGYPSAGHTFPVLYEGGMFEQTGEYRARIKVWTRNTWDWMEVTFRKTDADYIARHCGGRKKLCPTLVRCDKSWKLMFPFEEEVELKKESNVTKQAILAVDLGINNACACSVMRSDGTVIARRMFRMKKEEDCLTHLLNKAKKEQSKGHRHLPTLWSRIQNANSEISKGTARFIAAVAAEFNVYAVVFEALDMGGKKKGAKSKRQRLHMWKCRDVQSMVSCKVHRLGIHVTHVNAWNTSRLAYDGSGKVERGIHNNYSICRFTTGKEYNCDLNASYNIGARYFIREIIKSMPVTAGLGISAKVPECTKRSTCTLSTLISLNAALAA